MAPPRTSSPCPPSPVPFVPPTAPEPCRSPTWDEYLAGSSSNGSLEFGFPAAVAFGDPSMAEPRSTRPGTSTSTSGGRSSSYTARPGYPPPRRLSPAPTTNHKRKVSPVSFPTPPPPLVMTFPPLSAGRPDSGKTLGMKTVRNGDTGSQVGRWTKREHELFLEGLQRFGKSWKKISSLVHTRTLVQIRTHAQKYLQKQSRAAIKADARAADAAASREAHTGTKVQQQQQQDQRLQQDRAQQQLRVAAPPSLEMDAPRSSAISDRLWRSPRAGDRSAGFAPLAFPSSLSASTSRVASSSSPRSAVQLSSVSRLDQLLQDDSTAIPAFVDEYYTSPTAIEDDLLRPLYTGEQWVPRLAHPAASVNYSNKRRRLETSATTCSSAPTSTTAAVPTLRPAFPSTAFQPLPAPDNVSSPSTSPSAYGQRQATAVLLAAHETDKPTNYTNAWL
ncbi:hypothetical protein PHYPSEUDO_010544 [Phytophthora pseudosyringae]|uniref:Myb-like DNA-binding protein n=1 Tax=Phytophthora pseudosyringae TaxID=221518 RepID=A0A8T1VD00_9STRA|nr:hypothetical protein PHYPSEUDO_010544 [Phytophthora pseudosyringae]